MTHKNTRFATFRHPHEKMWPLGIRHGPPRIGPKVGSQNHRNTEKSESAETPFRNQRIAGCSGQASCRLALGITPIDSLQSSTEFT